MALMRRESMGIDPFQELEELSSRLHRMFGLWPMRGGERETLASSRWSPSVNVKETDKEYIIMADLPGVKREDVHVKMEDSELTIQGERRQEEQQRGERFHRMESFYGSFMRRFTMPSDADESKIEATFQEGTLKITIGKSPSAKPAAKEIEIH